MNRSLPRNRMAVRWLPLLALLIAPALLIGMGLRHDARTVAQQDPPDRTPYGFLDLVRGRSLLAQLTAGEPDYGAVTVGIPGVGLFAPVAAVQATVVNPTNVQIAYSGAALLDTAATLDTELLLGTRGSGQSSSVSIQLTATLDPERHTGSAQLTYNGQQYDLRFEEPPHNAEATLQQIVAALNQQDAGQLYGLVDRRLRGAVSLSQFTSGFNSEFQALGSSMNARILVAPTYVSERWGYRTATGVIELTTSRWSAVALIYDEGGWKLKSFLPVPVDKIAVVAGGPYTAASGQIVTVTASPLNPAGGALTYAWDLDGNGSYETPGQSTTFAAVGITGPVTRTIAVRVTSGTGATATGQTTVTITAVTSAPLKIGAIDAPVAPVRVNTAVAVSATFTTPAGSNPLTATWTWGDGTTSAGTVTNANGTRTVGGGHQYDAPGVHTIRLTVAGPGGASDTAATADFVTVYDPAKGHATGGGRIVSPASACASAALCGGAAGQDAHLGFTAEYRLSGPPLRGSARFKAGDLNFRSTDVNVLTIVNARAQLRGRGVINGAGDYEFTLTAIDGKQPGGSGTDRFRITIRDRATGAVIYDTQPGAGDGAAATTPLGRGSILVRAEP